MSKNNPYSVFSETISLENIQQIGELITLKCLRGYCSYSRKTFHQLYIPYVQDLNRRNYPGHTFSDAYDLAQTAICFLLDFIGKKLSDVYTVKKRKIITIKRAAYNLVNCHITHKGFSSPQFKLPLYDTTASSMDENTTYCLRHTFATTCQQYVRPDIVDIWMGDSTTRLVGKVYTHFPDEFMLESMLKVEFPRA